MLTSSFTSTPAPPRLTGLFFTLVSAQSTLTLTLLRTVRRHRHYSVYQILEWTPFLHRTILLIYLTSLVFRRVTFFCLVYFLFTLHLFTPPFLPALFLPALFLPPPFLLHSFPYRFYPTISIQMIIYRH